MRPLPSAYKKSLEQAVSRYQTQLHLASEYLKGRGLDQDTAEEFRLGVVTDPNSGHESYVGRLAIPSLGPSGPYQLKFRCIEDHDCKDHGHAKYLTDAIDNRLFNVRALAKATPAVCITEGEIDAITLEQLGFCAVAAPGASTWKRHHARLFAGFERVYVFGDGDKPGRDFVRLVASSIQRAVRVTCPDGEDVNSIYKRKSASEIFLLMGLESP